MIKLIVFLSFITIVYCSKCYDIDNGSDCAAGMYACSWCPSTNQCGYYDACNGLFTYNETTYNCQDVIVCADQRTCNNISPETVAIIMASITSLTICGYIVVFACVIGFIYYACKNSKEVENV